MGASEIGVEEVLPQKRYYKNNLDCTGASERNLLQLKKSREELNIGISSKYLINNAIINHRMKTLRIA